MAPVKIAPGVELPHLSIVKIERRVPFFELKDGDLVYERLCVFRLRDRRFSGPGMHGSSPPVVSFGTDHVGGVWMHEKIILDEWRIQGSEITYRDVLDPAAVEIVSNAEAA
jgi:hypothetical protein